MRTIGMTSRFLAPIAALFMATGTALSLFAQAQNRHVAPAAGAARTASSKSAMTFEVASIRPSRPGTNWAQGPGFLPHGFQAGGETMWTLIMTAYNPDPPTRWNSANLLNAPGWVTQNMYDINARVAPGDVEAWQNQDRANRVLLRSAFQAMLRERCHLVLHALPFKVPYLDLVIGKNGLKIRAMTRSESLPKVGFHFPSGGIMTTQMHDGTIERHLYGVTMQEFATLLNQLSSGRPVQDKTGLTGRYDFTWRKQEDSGSFSEVPGGQLYRWPIDNLGLALKAGIGPATTFVVDHIEAQLMV